ncbi:MAG: hypothetical protein ACQEW9_08590 [Bacteroidota bacterium]|uniref:Uncharacterized protein n=1 Tax=Algoriphagus faecimaris TaxID=686796 RepID=A0A1G6NA41_9BACT|nr:hypothetical protein [Algoriphagus faecimaris]SDC64247.1 hypothetical protein SAMN04488104_100325 [Algoriphagus faecimaris]
MKFFYLSSKPNEAGKFEIHHRECDFIPDALERDYLGPFNNGLEAMRKAQSIQSESCLCEACCSNTFQSVFFKNKND